MSTVCIIPARGGSKRIPKKNVRPFLGRPIIAYSIAAARESGCFDRVMVSTDDEEIAAVAREAGAEIPFVRPTELADDFTGTAAVIRHAIQWLNENAVAPEWVCSVYATAPFVTPEDLAGGLRSLREVGCDFAVSVTSFAFPIQRALRVDPDGRLEMLWPENRLARSQDLEEAYHDAGQFYWGKASAWLADGSRYTGGTIPIVLPRARVQDIDTLEDWERAEGLYRQRHVGRGG